MTKEEPAMPVTAGNVVHSIGLTKREYMAAKIMASLTGNASINAQHPEDSAQLRARVAVINTDALIKELNR